MLTQSQSRLLTAVSSLALCLSLVDGALSIHNRRGQVALNEQQLFIQQTAPLEVLYRDMVKTLAETAVRSNDRQVLDMLAALGLNVTVNNAAPTAAK